MQISGRFRRIERIALISCVLAFLCSAFRASAEESWSDEPPLKLHVTIGDESRELESGKTATITIDGRERPISVKPAAYRTFNKSGVRFDYPASFRFRVEKLQPGEGLHYCVLEGDNVSVHLKEHIPNLDFDDFTEHLREKHRRLPRNVTVIDEQNVELKTSDGNFNGVSFELAASVGEQSWRQWDRCFLLPSRNKECCVLLAISGRGDELSRDAVSFLSVLERTLTIVENESPQPERQ